MCNLGEGIAEAVRKEVTEEVTASVTASVTDSVLTDTWMKDSINIMKKNSILTPMKRWIYWIFRKKNGMLSFR